MFLPRGPATRRSLQDTPRTCVRAFHQDTKVFMALDVDLGHTREVQALHSLMAAFAGGADRRSVLLCADELLLTEYASQLLQLTMRRISVD